MAVSYTHISRKPDRLDSVDTILREANDEFSQRDYNLFGRDWLDIYTEASVYDDFKNKLLEGLETVGNLSQANQEEILGQMLENSRDVVLQESLNGGPSNNFQPITAVSPVVLRKTWPKLALVNAIPTEVMTAPKATIQYMTTYFIDKDGNEVDIVQDFKQGSSMLAMRPRLNDKYYTLPTTASQNLFDPTGASAEVAAGLVGAGVDTGDFIDVDVEIESVIMTVDSEDVTFTPKIVLAGGINGTKGLPKIDTRTNSIQVELTATNTANVSFTDSITLKFDRKNGTFTGYGLSTDVANKVKSVKIKAFISSEMNNRTESIAFKLDQKEIMMPTAAHIDVKIPNEYVDDFQKMFSMDAVSILVNQLASFLAQRIDVEGLDFIKSRIDTVALDANGKYERVFNCHPYNHYTGSPTEWLTEIRGVIDNLAITILNDSRFDEGGYFVLVCNPIDKRVLTGTQWSFNSNAEVGGTRVNYQVGTYSGAYDYTVVSSTNVLPGSINMFYIPASQDQMTYKFFPYSLTIQPTQQSGMRVPSAPNIPGIIASRRAIFEYFREANGRIYIENNNGTYS